MTIMNEMPRCFKFYCNKAGLRNELSFKHLRKTNLTRMKTISGNSDIRTITGHSTEAILDNHYIDASSVASDRTKRGFRLFEDNVVDKNNKHGKQKVAS
jgi:intergrase/recombinase